MSAGLEWIKAVCLVRSAERQADGRAVGPLGAALHAALMHATSNEEVARATA